MSKLSDFVKDANRVAQYKSWISAPIGQEVLELLREHFLRPILPGALGQVIHEASSSFCLGENAGAWKVYDALRNLPNLEVQQSADPTEVYANAETPKGK